MIALCLPKFGSNAGKFPGEKQVEKHAK